MKKILKVVVPIGVIAAGFAVRGMLVAAAPKTEKKATVEQGVLVTSHAVAARDEQLRILARGSVVPARRVVVSPEVSGRVVWQNDELVPGGRLKKGKPLLRIDARDFTLNAQQQQANVERAELNLRLEQNRSQVAEREWEIIGEKEFESDEGKALALNQPQVATAKSDLAAAKSAHTRAQLAVGKTTLTVPFDAMVQERSVDIGQLVSPGMQLATLVGTEAYWVQVSVPVERLRSFAVPGLNAKEGEGAKARIIHRIGGEDMEREGRVIRLFGDLDPVGKMARVLVEIKDPLLLDSKPEERPAGALPLLVGAYVDVEILGSNVEHVVELPRSAVHDGSKVYVVGADQRLEIRNVAVAWGRPDTVLVSGGLTPGDNVVTSRVSAPVAGMLLRVAPSAAEVDAEEVVAETPPEATAQPETRTQ